MPVALGRFSKAVRKFGGAGRLGVDVTAGFVIADVTDVNVVDGLINVFAVDKLFVVADVKFPFACASICATSGDTSPNENDERLGVATFVVIGLELFVDTNG